MKKLAAFLTFFVLSMMLCITYAMAYIDPSAMTYIIQIVAGVVIAAGAAVGFYWRRIKRAVRRKKSKNIYDEDDDDEEDDEDE
ncbi:MAG: hypothetical protein KHW59_02080 [Clostridiales bacterium]|nr:hypothetical protein [Clostridiales bacterium]